jgi:hypothetical protein
MAAALIPVEPIPPDAAPAEPAHRQAARYVWALLLASIYEVLPPTVPEVRWRDAHHPPSSPQRW